MKKLFLNLLIMFVVFVNVPFTFSWDSTAAKLYPMAIGNVWSYNYKTYAPPNGCANLVSEYNYMVRIIGDTVMPNGKRYFKFEDRSSFFYRRIDSVKMNVMQYSTSSGNECVYDSLKAVTNSTYGGCSAPSIVTSISTINIYGFNRIRRDSRPVPCPGCGRTLVEGIGFYEDFTCLTSGNRTQMNGCIINGIQYGQILAIHQTGNGVPVEFSLSQNYPNPFNPETQIEFRIATSGLVKLTIYDALGKEVQTLVNQELTPGIYQAAFDGSNLPCGVYYYKLEADQYSQTKKMVFIK